MLAGPQEHGLAIVLDAGRQRREGVGLGGERGGEQAHVVVLHESDSSPPLGERRERGLTASCPPHLASPPSGERNRVRVLYGTMPRQRRAMPRDRARRGEPDRVAMFRDVTQRPLQMPQAVRLADEIGMQRHAHHQRPRRPTAPASRRTGRRSCRRRPRRRPCERRSAECRSLPADRAPRGCAAAAAAEPHRLVVHAPVEQVAIARLGQQVGRAMAVRNPRAEPALRRARPRLPSGEPSLRRSGCARQPRRASPCRSALVRPWPTISSPRVRQAAIRPAHSRTSCC